MIIEIEQGSETWLQLRKIKITATDAPIILNQSPFCTPERLLWKKLGIIPIDEMNDAMREGVRIEPIARALYEAESDCKMKPTVHVGQTYRSIICDFDEAINEWAMCSTDGISEDGSLVIEIKSGKKSWEMAQNGVIPSYYEAQMQHILWLTGAQLCDYVACNGQAIKIIPVLPDFKFREYMIEEEFKFYQLLNEHM